MNEGAQARVVRFLAGGEAFGGQPVEHIETHLSHIFLAGDDVYKLKRAVRFNFVDLSSVERRKWACERELSLNRRTAPNMYLGVLPVTQAHAGLALAGEGEAVDWLVHMRRFNARDQFDVMCREGRLRHHQVSALVEKIIDLHRHAAQKDEFGGGASIKETADNVAANLEAYGVHLTDTALLKQWRDGMVAALSANAALLDQRRTEGRVRQCHGDMHLANICLFDGEPTLFDCIEFNDEIACIDVLYDLAFLCMDLLHAGEAGFANLTLNRYLSATRDYGGLPAMPLFLSLRAAIRAMATVIEASEREAGADQTEVAATFTRRMDLAIRCLQKPSARLVGIGGLSGSGKSTLAAKLAPTLAPGAGATIISSDITRKRLWKVTPETRLPPAAYSGEASAKTYGRMIEDVEAALRAGQTVVADATFLREEDRIRLSKAAEHMGVPFAGIWLDVGPDILKKRVEARRHDPSDADAGVVQQQLEHDLGAITWQRLNAGADDLVASALAMLGG